MLSLPNETNRPARVHNLQLGILMVRHKASTKRPVEDGKPVRGQQFRRLQFLLIHGGSPYCHGPRFRRDPNHPAGAGIQPQIELRALKDDIVPLLTDVTRRPLFVGLRFSF